MGEAGAMSQILGGKGGKEKRCRPDAWHGPEAINEQCVFTHKESINPIEFMQKTETKYYFSLR